MTTETDILSDLAAVRARIARLEAEDARLRAAAPMRYTYPADAAVPAAEAFALANAAAERAATAVLRACADGNRPRADALMAALAQFASGRPADVVGWFRLCDRYERRGRAWRKAATKYRKALQEAAQLTATLCADDRATFATLRHYGVDIDIITPTADGVHALVSALAGDAEYWRRVAHSVVPAALIDSAQEVLAEADAQHAALFGEEAPHA